MSPLIMNALAFATLLFALRVVNYAVSTIRLVFLARGKRFITAFMAFFEALLFAVVMAGVVADLSNMLNLLAYCLGAAVGSYVGMAIEARVITSFATVQIIMNARGESVAQALRECGYGVTETIGRGRDGEVVIVRSSVNSKDVPTLIRKVHEIVPEAFIEVEAARTVHYGFIPGITARTFHKP